MGFKKISELDPAALVNDSDLFAGAQEENNTLDNKKYTAEQLKLYFQDGTQSELTFDDVPVENSNNPVKSGGLYSEFATKQDALTFDAMPIDGSSNPVTSDGIEEAIASSESRSIPLSQKGEAGGVAELDSSGKVLSSQLPSYVDDVEEYLSRSAFPVFGEGGKIYIALDTNLAYRWTGSGYAEVSQSLALGETSSTAYRGDRGKTAYDFSQSPYASAPAMDGVASAGSSTSWARGDHVHPKDASKQDVLTFDNAPTENSANPVKSGGVYSALVTKQDKLIFDDVPVEDSPNPVTSGGLYSTLENKQDTLSFDDVPTENSDNPVKSGGIYDAILKLYPTDTASGSVASFQNGADNVPVVDLKVSIEPVQDLHGYDHPWPSGSGKNKCKFELTAPVTNNGITYTPQTNGTVIVNGTNSSQYDSMVTVASDFNLPAGDYILSGSVNGAITVQVLSSGVQMAYQNSTPSSFTVPNDTIISVRILVFAGRTANNYVVSPMIRLASATDPTFEPNSNICPISGWTGMTISHSGSDISDPEALSVSWQSEAGTVYGGTLDVTTGILTVTHGQIASYAGETLPGEWISDRDVYAAGTSPSTGAQVVYALAQPEIYQLTPTEVRTLLGDNNIWADCGDVELEYRADPKLYIDSKIEALAALMSEL